MTPRVAHVIVRGDQLTLHAPYDPSFLEDLKLTIPYQHREWDRVAKVWLVGCCQAELIAICRAHFARVTIHDETAAALTSSSDWAAALFDALPKHLWRPAYRALSRVLHPDAAGGDLASMQTLAAAYTERTAA